MKFSRFLVGTLACTMFVACSNDESPAVDSGQEEGQLSYVSVNIVNANSTGSRAEGDNYDDGEPEENKITNARFYLFKANGDAYELSNSVTGWSANYVEKSGLSGNPHDPEDDNVEEIVNATLVFQGKDQELPASIVAILNPPTTTLGNNAKSLSDLQKEINDYSASSDGAFIMSNSVYASGTTTKTEVVATDIVGKVAQSKEDAEANPVDIYVERVLAKVEVTFSGAEKEASEDDGPQYIVSGTGESAVYAEVLGWAVTTDNRTSNLLKDIDVTWNNIDLGFTWNDEPYHRSYWASTPSTITPVNDKSAEEIIEETGNVRYCQENTLSTHTNVIVVAQLVNNSGVAQPIYKYYGMNYTSENDILELIANKYANVYYTKTSQENQDTYVSIAPKDMEFKATTSTETDNYEAIAVLKSDITIYTPNPDYNAETPGSQKYVTVDADDVNAELAKNPAQIAKDGYVYYYTPIKHLGTTGKIGEYGVVRNHVYKVSITDINGFGTPIYDPDKDIIPTHPTDEETYIAARINVLSWRVVPSSVTLQ